MSKILYDDYVGDDPFFSPCIHCGCPEFHMDWDTMIYNCSDCNKPIDKDNSNYGKERKPKEKVKKFKGED
jgi:hypothetical protein